MHLTSVHSPLDTRIFFKECQSLASAGFDVVLVAPHAHDEVRDGIQIRGVTPAESRFERMLRTGPKVVARARAERGAVYHLHDPELLPWAGPLARQGAVIFDMHEDLPRQILTKPWLPRWLRPALAAGARLAERWLLRGKRVVLAEASYQTGRPWLQDPVTVLNFPRVNWLEELGAGHQPGERRRLAYLGAVTPQRGSLRTIEALGRLQAQGRELGFACVGPVSEEHRTQLLEAASRHGLADVSVPGYLPAPQGWEELIGCVAGLALLEPQPNYLESYPTKLFEYMALGLPVIASDFPLYREIVSSAGCGLVVNPLDVEGIAAAVGKILDDPDQAIQMGLRGRRAARERFSWESEEKKLLDLYGALSRQAGG